jgi:hypothetical protein
VQKDLAGEAGIVRCFKGTMNRQHIIDEIVRTATENGGIALGRERFYQETGIKESDWLGKYWARWSEAVTEAGFTPKKLNPPLDESTLLDCLVAFIREIGHVPVVAELKLKATHTAGFPSHNTFRKFGNKTDLVGRLMQYCEGIPQYEDVLVILRTCKPGRGRTEEEPDAAVEAMGFVYLLKVGRNYKIGRANSFERRSRELAIQLPERAETVHVIRTDDPVGIESYWHRRFGSKRKNGEWFDLNAQDIKAFRRRKFM